MRFCSTAGFQFDVSSCAHAHSISLFFGTCGRRRFHLDFLGKEFILTRAYDAPTSGETAFKQIFEAGLRLRNATAIRFAAICSSAASNVTGSASR
jgi:hypothetical protein